MLELGDRQKLIKWSLWALWGLILGGATVWLLVGSVAYFVKEGWLPADTSGWVQALGAIAAVGVALAVPAWQKSHERNDRLMKERRERWDAALAVLALVSSQINIFGAAISRLPHQVSVAQLFDPTVAEALQLLAGCKEDLESLDLAQFGAEHVDRMLQLKSNARFCGYVVDRYTKPSLTFNAADLLSSIAVRKRKLQEVERSLLDLFDFLEAERHEL